MPLEVQALLASITAAIDLAKLVKGATLSLAEASHKMELAELMGALADAKIKATEIQELLLAKDQRIRELEQVKDITSRLRFHRPYYMLRVGEDQEDGPYCQQCWDSNSKLIRLQGGANGFWECKTCKANFTGSNYRPPFSSGGRRFSA